MDIGFRHLDDLCLSLVNKNTLEENLSHIINNIDDEIKFQSLGIFIKIRNENNYQIKIHRHLSHHFVKQHIISSEDKLIEELQNRKYIHKQDNSIKFEFDYKDLIIFPLFFHSAFNGFLFIDSKEQFSVSDIAKLNVFITLLSLIMEIDNLQQNIEHMNELDPVTGLFNHKSFIKLTEKNHTHMNRYNREYSIALLKINKFDEIAQVLGNYKIPLLLQEVSAVINKSVRETDYAGILYPDTFAIYFSEVNKDIAKMVVERIHNTFIRSPRLTGMQFKWGVNDNFDREITFDMLFKQTEEALQNSIRSLSNNISLYIKEE